MHTTFALAALAAVAYARPQGVSENIAPQAAAPAGCSPSHSGAFQIQAVNFTTSAKAKRQACGSEGTLTVNLADGVLTDSKGRIGAIVANYQFQFDGPPAQTGSIYTAGFSVCGNGSLALGGSAVFYQCYSGGFYNLYDRHWAEQCNPILLDILPCGGSSPGVGQSADGQPTGTATGVATQIGDGQPQVSTAAPISQIGDGQPQATTAVIPVSQIADGQIQAPSSAAPMPVAPISQIGDGQIQATSVAAPAPSAPISQIGDGQIQATSVAAPKPAAPISQISDGQIQATSVAPAPTAVAPISQISDGQIQATSAVAPKPTGGIVSQIGDGQIQTNGTTPIPFTGAASPLIGSSVAAFVVAGLAVAFL